MNCDYCTKEHGRRRFCSTYCKDEWHKQQKRNFNRRWLMSHPIYMRKCKYCLREVVPTRRCNEYQQHFCSNLCKKEFHKLQEKLRRDEIRRNTIRTCPICESQFSPKKTMKEIYCSNRCQKCIGRKVYKMMSSCYQTVKSKKSECSHKVLGYSPNELLGHLQSFRQWNKLKNKTWHLDHIFPIIAFVRAGIKDVAVMCRLDNLQPLSGRLNCVKNDDYDEVEFREWLDSIT